MSYPDLFAGAIPIVGGLKNRQFRFLENLLHVPGGVSRGFELPAEEGDPRYAQMKGNEVFKMAVNTLGRIVDDSGQELPSQGVVGVGAQEPA